MRQLSSKYRDFNFGQHVSLVDKFSSSLFKLNQTVNSDPEQVSIGEPIRVKSFISEDKI